jgi:prevent-host-death family protein
MDIGVRELKQRLSEILDRAAAGELIRVTDRGRPKAVIGPSPGVSSLQTGIAAGWITPPRSTAPPTRVVPVKARRSSASALREDRDP